MKSTLRASVLALTSLLCVSSSAMASTIITDYRFSGTETGTFSLAFDNVANSFSLSSFDMTLGSTHFDASNTGIDNFGFLLIGGLTNGANSVSAFTDDFFFGLNVPTPASTESGFTFATTSSAVQNGSITIDKVAAVPEPATWAMMLMGVFGVGTVLRRRSPVAAA